jgi:hypothetical protein
MIKTAELYLVAKPSNVYGAKTAYQYIAYVDPRGKESQMHGFAVDKNTGEIKTFGKKGNKLKTFVIGEESEFFDKHFEKNGLNTYPKKLLFSGKGATTKWEIAKKIASNISSEDSKYDPVAIDKPNGNSVAATVCSVLGVKSVQLGNLPTPGLKKAIFSKEKYDILRKDEKDALEYDFYSGDKAAIHSIHSILKGNGVSIKEEGVQKIVDFAKSTGLDRHIEKWLKIGKFDWKEIIGGIVKGVLTSHPDDKKPGVDISGGDSDLGDGVVDFISSLNFKDFE